jgi:hypothetical protein
VYLASSADVHRQYYKPLILQIPGLLFIFTITLALIGALEYAARTLPLAENRIHVPDISRLDKLQQRRQTSDGNISELEFSPQVSHISISSTILATILLRGNDISVVATTSTQPSTPSLTTRVASQSASPTLIALTETTIPSAYMPTDSTSSQKLSELTLPSTNPSAYMPITSVSAVLSTNPSAYMPTDSTSSQKPSELTSPGIYTSNSYMATGSTSTKASNSSPSPVLRGSSTTTSRIPLSTIATNAYLPTATKVLVSTLLSTDASGHVRTILNSYTITQTLEIITQTGISTVITIDSAGHTQKTTSPYTTVATLQPTATDANSTKEGNPKFDTVLITWPLWWVFAAGYLPLLLAILVKVFWTSVYANVKLIEPFIQLSKHDGALARDTLHTYYLSSNLTPDPILAFFKGRWLIFWTSFVYLVVGLLAPLASEVLFLDTHYGCGTDTCWPPKLSADGVVLRLLQGLLSFIAIMALTIMIIMHGSTTGVYSNPSSIASIASLLHHPDVLDDFRNLNDSISAKNLKKQLGNKRYQMGMYREPDEGWRYGIVPASQNYSPGWTQIPLNQSTGSTKPETKRTHHISTALDIGFAVFILGLLGVAVVYFLDGSNSGFNRFFNSNAFGPRFFMVCIPRHSLD